MSHSALYFLLCNPVQGKARSSDRTVCCGQISSQQPKWPLAGLWEPPLSEALRRSYLKICHEQFILNGSCLGASEWSRSVLPRLIFWNSDERRESGRLIPILSLTLAFHSSLQYTISSSECCPCHITGIKALPNSYEHIKCRGTETEMQTWCVSLAPFVSVTIYLQNTHALLLLCHSRGTWKQ